MTIACWIIEREDGSTLALPREPTEADGPYTRVDTADRLAAMDGTEDWSFDTHAWVVNADRCLAWTNRRYVMDHGAHAIDVARAMKALEARLILAGTMVEGYVTAEAEATGQKVEALAQIVVTNAAANIEAEAARIAERDAVRKGET